MNSKGKNQINNNKLLCEVQEVMKSRVEVAFNKTEEIIIEILEESISNRIDEKFKEVNRKLSEIEKLQTRSEDVDPDVLINKAVKKQVAEAFECLMLQEAKEKKRDDLNLLIKEAVEKQVAIKLQELNDKKQDEPNEDSKSQLNCIQDELAGFKETFLKYKEYDFPIMQGIAYACEANVNYFTKDLCEVKEKLKEIEQTVKDAGNVSLERCLSRSEKNNDHSKLCSKSPFLQRTEHELTVVPRDGAVAEENYSANALDGQLQLEFEQFQSAVRRELENIRAQMIEIKVEIDRVPDLDELTQNLYLHCESLRMQCKHLYEELTELKEGHKPRVVHQEGFVTSIIESAAIRTLFDNFTMGMCYYLSLPRDPGASNTISKILLCPLMQKCYAKRNDLLTAHKLDQPFYVSAGDDTIEITEFYNVNISGDVSVQCYIADQVCKTFDVVFGLNFFKQFEEIIQISGKSLRLGKNVYYLINC